MLSCICSIMVGRIAAREITGTHASSRSIFREAFKEVLVSSQGFVAYAARRRSEPSHSAHMHGVRQQNICSVEYRHDT